MSVRAAIAATASAAAAGAASLCCIPILSAFAGAGIATMSAAFAPFRPLLVLATLALLGFAFVQVYRPRPDCEDACSVKTMRHRRPIAWIAAAVALIVLTAGYWMSWLIYWLA